MNKDTIEREAEEFIKEKYGIEVILELKEKNNVLKLLAERICRKLGYRIEELCENNRSQDLVHARYIAIYLISERYFLVKDELIARLFNMERTSVIHARKMFLILYKKDDNFKSNANYVKSRL